MTEKWYDEKYEELLCSQSAYAMSCPVLLSVECASMQTKEQAQRTKPECSECNGPYSAG